MKKKSTKPSFFSPKSEILEKLSYKDQRKIGRLIIGDKICFVLFLIFAVALVVLKLPLVGILMALPTLMFFISLFLIKAGKLVIGSYSATFGFIAASFVIAFFAGPCDNAFVHYRTGCFCVVMAILNFMVSLRKPQLLVYHIASFVILFTSAFSVYIGVFQTDILINNLTSLVVNSLGIFAANMMLFSSSKFNEKILVHSENEHDKAEENLHTITDALVSANESLNIGQELNNATASASDSIENINKLYHEVSSEADMLRNQTSVIKNTSHKVISHADKMSQAVQKQNASLSVTSTTMTEISSNINSINTIAERRREGMDSVVNLLDTQGTLVKNLVRDVEKVKESSNEIAKFVATVDSIAGQTNLLAMNASIEAAHAGAMGKGFGVIAQEIRKLSVETSKNASKIADTLKENTEVVQATSDSVNAFANSTESSTEEIRQTINSMEEILKGIDEINLATQGATNSIQEVVDLSQQTEQIIVQVVNQVSEQNTSLEFMSHSTDILQEKVESINSSLTNITSAINDIHKNAQDNEAISEKIAKLLN